MPDWVFDYWQALVGLVAIIGVVIAWRQYRRPSRTTTNIATDSDRVRQSGGTGTTHNEARNSRDVEQSG